MFIEVLIERLVQLAIVVLALAILYRGILKPVFGYFWEPYRLVMEAKQKERIAKARLEATRLEVKATQAWSQAGEEVDTLIEEEEQELRRKL